MSLGVIFPAAFTLASVPTFAWEFGGPLAGWSPETAWRTLGVVGFLGALGILLSYSRTLVRLPLLGRSWLITLRLLLWFGLLMILAGPTRVEKEFAQISRRPLAVLVDRSGSMTKPDHRGQQRLDQALRSWSLLAPVAAATTAGLRLSLLPVN